MTSSILTMKLQIPILKGYLNAEDYYPFD